MHINKYTNYFHYFYFFVSGAVVAREYGLPSIVGVKNVTKCFKTGDLVILNGDKGELAKIAE